MFCRVGSRLPPAPLNITSLTTLEWRRPISRAAVAAKLEPGPASLPSDQKITDGWFLWVWKSRSVRSMCAVFQVGLLPRLVFQS